MTSFPVPDEYKIVRHVQSVRTYVTELDQSNTPTVTVSVKLVYSCQFIMAVTMCPAPGQITVILCVRRAATSQPGRIAANLFVRRAGEIGH